MGEAERVVSGSISDIVSRFNGLGGRVSSAIGTIHFPVPKISTEYLTVGNTSIPIPRVSWNALGGYYDEPSIIGVGEAGGELVLPQSGGIMDPFAETVAQKVGRNDADKVIAWLDDNLPYIIEHFTPTIGERDFNRLARRAYA